jgi:outer membrane protein OmpA-like peptidoglycan-associated protein
MSDNELRSEEQLAAGELTDSRGHALAEQPALQNQDLSASDPAVVQAVVPASLTGQSSYVRLRSARRLWRRRLAALLTAGFFLSQLLYGATVKRSTFEAKLERRAKTALGSNEFSSVRIDADGRNLILKGSVASVEDAKLAQELVKRVRFVQDVDISKLVVGGSDGNVLPLRAVYAEGRLSFEGSRPSEEALSALIQAASKGLGDGNVRIQFAELTGTGGDPDAYASLGAAFGRFVDLQVRSAVIDVTQDETIITGRLGKVDGQAEIVQSLADATSRAVRDNLEIETPGSGDTVTGTTIQTAGTDPVPPTTTAGLNAEQKATMQAEVSATLKTNRIEFTTDSAALGERAKSIIAELAAQLKPSGVAFEVGGHTDSRGRAEKNQQLSQRRADAVRDEFVKNGVDPQLVTAVGFGSAKTVASDGPRGNPLNRRIEITLK